jgi:general secretion pathway protein C
MGMHAAHNHRMNTQRLSFVIAAVAGVAVGVAAWALRKDTPAGNEPASTNTVSAAGPMGNSIAPVVATQVSPAAPSASPAPSSDRFTLAGVMAAGVSANGREGVALIAVDGQPARAFRVGETVERDIVVLEVSARGAVLGTRGGGPAMALEVSLAPAPTAGMTTAPAADTKLQDGSAQAEENLRKFGSKHPPIPPPVAPVPQQPVNGAAPAVDDGRWRPAGS